MQLHALGLRVGRQYPNGRDGPHPHEGVADSDTVSTGSASTTGSSLEEISTRDLAPV